VVIVLDDEAVFVVDDDESSDNMKLGTEAGLIRTGWVSKSHVPELLAQAHISVDHVKAYLQW
jgi:hypothetical protein